MNIVEAFVGVDVAKDELVVEWEHLGKVRRSIFSNSVSGFAELICWLGDVPARVSMESSGGYERGVRHALEAACYTVQVHNPRRVRRLAQGLGLTAKTDALDARALARASSICPAAPTRSKEREELAEISRTIAQLTKERSDHLRRLAPNWVSPAVRSTLEELVGSLTKAIAELEALYKKLVHAGVLSQRHKLALSVPCVGPKLARVLTSELPEDLSRWTIRQLASYVGLAPKDNASGRRVGPSRIGVGNTHLKAALYMPALTAVQRQAWAGELYARLKAKGKAHQQAIVAVMRRLLTMCLAVLKRGSAWQPEPLNN